jgi:hypothetical protein
MMHAINRLVPQTVTKPTTTPTSEASKKPTTTYQLNTTETFKPYTEIGKGTPSFSNEAFFNSDLGMTPSVSALSQSSESSKPLTPKAVNTDTLFNTYGFSAIKSGKTPEAQGVPSKDKQPTISADLLNELKHIGLANKEPYITTSAHNGDVTITVPRTENGKGGYVVTVDKDGKMLLRASQLGKDGKDGFVTNLPQADAESILADTVAKLSKRPDFIAP